MPVGIGKIEGFGFIQEIPHWFFHVRCIKSNVPPAGGSNVGIVLYINILELTTDHF